MRLIQNKNPGSGEADGLYGATYFAVCANIKHYILCLVNFSLPQKGGVMKYRKFIKLFDLNDGVKKSKHLTPAQIRVYGYLHSWWEGHETGNREGYETIAANCGVARSTFALAIVRLEKLGWIAVQHGARISETKNECNAYQIARMPEAHIKYTKEKIVTQQLVIDKPTKTAEQKIMAKKYAMLKMAKGTLSHDEYQELKAFLKI